MSAYNTGIKLCTPEGNGCLCGVCVYRRLLNNPPKECHGGGCLDCDPDRTEPNDDEGYGPTRECSFFKKEK